MSTYPATVTARFGFMFALMNMLSACSLPRSTAPAPTAELAPSGKLSAVINLGNPTLASTDSAGQPRCVG